jgi:hypothetical protein
MKRFTESLKWDDPWFQALDLDHRLAWIYLLDRCDCSGVWEPNFRTGNFHLARDIDWPTVKATFIDAKRVCVLPSGKWWVCKFVEFQYGELKAKSPIHQKVLTLLLRHGLDESQLEAFVKGWRRVRKALNEKKRLEALPKGSRTLQEEEEVRAPEPCPQDQAAAIYAAYPRKVGKQAAIRAIRLALKVKTAAALLERVAAYAAATARWPAQDRQYIPHPATWFNQGRYDDAPEEWERGAPIAATPDHTQQSAAKAALLAEKRGLLALSPGTPEEMAERRAKVAEIDRKLAAP